MTDFEVKKGVYPTMITPYKDGKIDFDGVRALVRFYWESGCDGIFAACQSSEIMFLTLDERVSLVREVVAEAKKLAANDTSRPPLMIVASGHVSDSLDDQAEELCRVAAEGPDAIIMISNRLDIANTTDEAWIADAEKLLTRLPEDIPLGIYECPKPYKRLLTDAMLKWCISTERFYFIKDTCCDADLIAHRLDVCRGSRLEIFNANAQTLLPTLKSGCAGYCGVMANFHPELYVSLWNKDFESREASLLQDYLGLAATAESLTYPCCAKDFLNRHRGIAMETFARSADEKNYTPYQRGCIDQFAELSAYMTEIFK
ncbi:MAG: dihydrodipicolinate synthase family protein [Clostridia bacterium]|nr:dihydrodipicolinate synthase family protein [Clostridia bacterium]